MALLFPTTADIIALKALLGVVAQAEDVVIGLFTSNTTPAKGDTAATYTAIEAAGGGYARKTMAKGSWVVTALPFTFPSQTWTFTGPLTGSATIYGYFILRATSLDLLYAENFGSGFQPLVNNDALTVNAQLSAN